MSSAVLASDVNVAQNVGFYIIAAGMVWGALRVVTTKNVVHGALWLIVVLGGAAAQYILVATRDGDGPAQAGGFERGSHEGSYEFEFRKGDGTWRFSRQLIVTNNAHNPMFAA